VVDGEKSGVDSRDTLYPWHKHFAAFLKLIGPWPSHLPVLVI